MQSTVFFSISEFCKHLCPEKEMNELVPKRSKHDAETINAALIVDDVTANSSNQATGGSKLDFQLQKRKIVRKPGPKKWNHIEVNKTAKL